MKCLSIAQPFADLVASGRKKIELRNWNTGFRGEFLVHAPLRVWHEDVRRLKISRSKKFVTGAIVGKAEICGVKTYATVSECRRDAGLHLASARLLMLPPPPRYKYGFVIKNAKMFRIPVPCRGKLGFFEAQIPRNEVSDDFITADIIDEEYRYQWIGRH